MTKWVDLAVLRPSWHSRSWQYNVPVLINDRIDVHLAASMCPSRE